MGIKTLQTPRRIRPSIKKDKVNAFDFQNSDHRFSCDECSHFDSDNSRCTLGYISIHHRKEQQTIDFLMSGHLAFCRFHEID